MFNPEKLLGGMLRSGCRGRGLGSLMTGGAALGLIGVAMEAVEHYMNKPASGSQDQSPSVPPPLPDGQVPSSAGGPPPPPPGARKTPPPAPPGKAQSGQREDAVLLIRAMIAAANADGVIDADERARILERLKAVDLSQEEHQFIVHELLAPRPLADLLADVNTPQMARQVYAVSLLVIEVDTEAERVYLRDLARRLNLDEQTIEELHRQLGLAPMK